eukprot:CAMPEP_0172605198 /NCGR_PEP_ID=MMETSP1068-20121228/25437_1 /TAXON_ID=35684 /ORGANISM="Pseudopedinella elastica, Strain CCMP716" /LENGTH=136 /DNA_ID=CAMNT_0013407525 /DNA_START=444 /DNA_END=855 /DNA_ORIENTATION=-
MKKFLDHFQVPLSAECRWQKGPLRPASCAALAVASPEAGEGRSHRVGGADPPEARLGPLPRVKAMAQSAADAAAATLSAGSSPTAGAPEAESPSEAKAVAAWSRKRRTASDTSKAALLDRRALAAAAEDEENAPDR